MSMKTEEFDEVEYRRERKLAELEIEAMLWEYDIERMFERFQEKAPIPQRPEDVDWANVFAEELERWWEKHEKIMAHREEAGLDRMADEFLKKLSKDV